MNKTNPVMDCPFSQLDTANLKFNARTCDCCGANNGIALYSVPFLGKQFQFVKCPGCGLVYQNPSLTKESLEIIYEAQEYWDHKNLKSCDTSTMLNYYSYLEESNVRKKTCQLRMEWIKRYLPMGSRVLDLGCSDGLFVKCLTDAGYKACGMDISHAMVSHSKKTYGIEVFQADFEGEWPFQDTFDAITCYATLSNITRPSLVFKNIRKHLRPGGFMFFNFGDRGRLISRMLGSRLYLYRPTASTIYTRKNIIDYLGMNGFVIENISNDIQVVPLMRLIGFFRILGLIKAFKLLGMEESNMKIHLLTGYAVRAVLV